MEGPSLRQRAKQAERLGRQMTNSLDRDRLLKIAAELYAKAEMEDLPERKSSQG